MTFHDVPMNRSVSTEDSRGLTSYTCIASGLVLSVRAASIDLLTIEWTRWLRWRKWET
ncbi:hypothetical protein CC86DRAFT_433925 [Ophiobolus disseminans]|uniref:Uncharacterized protein n=1 Tax=Ophiobolus disseminans TaxID=1469910 RepID=A0A6A6ZBG2_9PLEO|nr:hypothetical protein CC86DRAFT_433925 [Ophiobolus disseminans]